MSKKLGLERDLDCRGLGSVVTRVARFGGQRLEAITPFKDLNPSL